MHFQRCKGAGKLVQANIQDMFGKGVKGRTVRGEEGHQQQLLLVADAHYNGFPFGDAPAMLCDKGCASAEGGNTEERGQAGKG